MNRGLVALVCLAVGCDDAICPSQVFIAIQTSEVSIDDDPVMPGVQTDLRVRTSLTKGEVELLIAASGQSVGIITAADIGPDGIAIFEHVTIPDPEAKLHASVSSECGDASDEATIPVAAGARCDLIISPPPEDIAFFAPARVLNSLADPDPTHAGFDAKLIVATDPGFSVEIFDSTDAGSFSRGSFPVGADGTAQATFSFEDSHRKLRALCTNGARAAVSPIVEIVVDTTPPTCTISIPAPGTTITPAFDDDLDTSNGVQMFVAGQIDGDDVRGEPTTLSITEVGEPATSVVTTVIDDTGKAGGTVSLTPATTPATFSFEFGARDHARNPCTVVEDYVVDYNACNLVVTSPTAPVTSDANGTAADGSQVDVSLLVSTACAGRTVTSQCGTNNPSGVVGANGQLTLRTDWCATSPCELTNDCTFSVTSTTGITTNTATTISFDDQGPPTTVSVVDPAVACGSTVTLVDDIEPAVEGVQVTLRVDAPGAATQSLEHTSATGTVTTSATTDVTLTLDPGLNSFVGIAADALANTTRTAACTLSLEDLTVAFSPPAADGTVDRTDGTVVGNSLSFPLCGTVNVADTPVTLSIDGASPVGTTVTGTTWCRTIVLKKSPPSHTITATATLGTTTATATLVLAVDLHP